MDLQARGLALTRHLGLDDFLSKFGEAHLVGNLALGTTVRADIDYSVYVGSENWESTRNEISDYLSQKGITDNNFRILKQSGKCLLSYIFVEDDLPWDLHITLSEPTRDYLTDSYLFVRDYQDKFTPEIVKTILSLKKYFLTKNMLRNSMSFFIYRAVIDGGAKTPSDIYDYLNKHKLYIGRFKLPKDKQVDQGTEISDDSRTRNSEEI